MTGVERDDDDESSAEHPVFRPHPLTGRIALYLSTPQRCRSITGMSDDEAQETVAAHRRAARFVRQTPTYS